MRVTRRWSMTSFAVEIEPPAQLRLAALALMVHLAAAASPWIARCPASIALALTLLALGGFFATITRIPGPHCGLQALLLDASACQVRVTENGPLLPASIGGRTRAYPELVVLEVIVGGRRRGWLLPRRAVAPAQFRRLKALIRLTC